LPDPRPFYEAALSPARFTHANSKGWATSCCPFHKSKSKRSFSINFVTGAFCCFSPDCAVRSGDVIQFVRLLHRCDFRRACQILGVWRDGDLTEQDRAQLEDQQKERERQQQQQAAAVQQARHERLQKRDDVIALAGIMRTAEEELDADPQNENWWAVAATAFEQLRAAELEYLQASGFSEEDL